MKFNELFKRPTLIPIFMSIKDNHTGNDIMFDLRVSQMTLTKNVNILLKLGLITKQRLSHKHHIKYTTFGKKFYLHLNNLKKLYFETTLESDTDFIGRR